MQRITTLKSTQQAKDYFNKELSKGDYYSREQAQEVPSRFGGKLAERMGLANQEVSRQAFFDLIEHRNPVSGEKLTRRKNEAHNRRPGTDITFSAPKSVSVYYQHTRDPRVLAAFESAVQGTMKRDIEPLIAAGVRQNGDSRGQRTTGSGLWSTFLHHTARPAKQRDAETNQWKQLVPDPHTHAHVILHNVTWDEQYRNRNGSKGAYVAVEAGEIHLARPYTEASFHARLAKKLTDLGLAVQRTDHGFELAGFTESMKQTYSQRTAQIEQVAKERNVRSAELKAKLAQSTRSNKSELSMDELRFQWDSRLSPQQWKAFLAAARDETGEGNGPVTPAVSLKYGVSHALARQSVATDREVLQASLDRGMGWVTVDELKPELTANEQLIRREMGGKTLITSQQVLASEQEVLRFAADGIGKYRPLGAGDYQIQSIMKEGQQIDWHSDQYRAIQHLLESRDSVTVIRGAAGVGKTTLLQEATRGIRANDTYVWALAPTSAAADVLKADGFNNAQTIAMFLRNEQQHGSARNCVLLVDEAELVGTEDMNRLFRVAQAQKARVILSGDFRQHAAVARGQPMRQILEQTPVKAAEVTTITRQRRDGYREAVRLLSEGTPQAVRQGFDQLVEQGYVREVADADRYKELAAAYLSATGDGHQQAVMISPTHKEIKRSTDVLRRGLKEMGSLAAGEREVTQLKNLQLTDAEKSNPARYREGQFVQFFQNTSNGFRAGDRARITSVCSSMVQVVCPDGRRSELPLDRTRHFQVYERTAIEVAPGERIRITQNGSAPVWGKGNARYRLVNNQLFIVTGFTRSGDLKLDNGRVLPRHYGHLDYGYSSTSMAAQGRTARVNILAQSSESGRAGNMRQFYVSTSRGKDRLLVLTDDISKLKAAVVQDAHEMTAVDLARAPECEPSPTPQPEQQERQRRSYLAYVREGLRRADAYARRKLAAWRDHYQANKQVSEDKGVAYER